MVASHEPPVLAAHDLTVQYGGIAALHAVSMSVRHRTIHALIGPNGAGKTTFFNAITGMATLASGSILLHGEPIGHLPVHEIARRGLARTFQNLASFGDLTVEEHLLLGRHVQTKAGWLASGLGHSKVRSEARRQKEFVREMAERLSLGEFIHTHASRLAYGDRKRVELGRALCAEPSLLLLDEPVAGMNPAEVESMITAIGTLTRDLDLTVILVEHDMGMVARLADYISVLDFGKLIAEGPPSEVQNNPVVVEAYVGKQGRQLFETRS